MTEPELTLHFASQVAAKVFAKAHRARVSRTPLTYTVRLRPTTFQERLRLRLAAMDAGAVTDPLAKHQEWRRHEV